LSRKESNIAQTVLDLNLLRSKRKYENIPAFYEVKVIQQKKFGVSKIPTTLICQRKEKQGKVNEQVLSYLRIFTFPSAEIVYIE
jgi:hypothetical protein